MFNVIDTASGDQRYLDRWIAELDLGAEWRAAQRNRPEVEAFRGSDREQLDQIHIEGVHLNPARRDIRTRCG